MKEKISKYIITKPAVFQIAKDNKYEQSWIIDIQKVFPTKEEVETYLNKEKFTYLAIEIQWSQPEGAYVLTILFSKCMIVKNPQEFILKMFQLVNEYQNFDDLINRIDKEIIGREYLFKQDLEYVSVGIFNHWFSTGPVVIWQKGDEKIINKAILDAKFKGHEYLLKTDLNFQAMAYGYCKDFEKQEFGIRHIFHSPSAKKVEDTWHLDFDQMLKYLHEWENFK